MSNRLKSGVRKAKREFMYVDDLSESINFIIENNVNVNLLNIGSGYEITIKELALKIKDIVGFSGEVSFNTSMPDGIERKFLNSKKVMDLGWSPKISLEDGLIKTYDWFQKTIRYNFPKLVGSKFSFIKTFSCFARFKS